MFCARLPRPARRLEPLRHLGLGARLGLFSRELDCRAQLVVERLEVGDEVAAVDASFVKGIAEKSPGPIALTLAEPVAVDDVAGAVAAGVMGRNSSMSCDGTDEIKACAAAL